MQSSNIDTLTEDQIVLQSDTVSYDKAYKANNSPPLDIFQLADIIALVLTEILKETNKSTDNFTSAFHSKRVPSISVKDYLTRIAKCAKCSPECLILALIYLDRLTERNKRFIIKSLNIHRLLMTSVMLAAKFFDDQFYNNEYYARVGGMTNQEINALEIEFLNLINFNLHVNPVVFFKYRQRLVIQAKTVFAKK
jgi:hypothetical protein